MVMDNFPRWVSVNQGTIRFRWWITEKIIITYDFNFDFVVFVSAELSNYVVLQFTLYYEYHLSCCLWQIRVFERLKFPDFERFKVIKVK